MLNQQSSGIDRNAIIAFFLIFLILIGFSWWAERNTPTPPLPTPDSNATAPASNTSIPSKNVSTPSVLPPRHSPTKPSINIGKTYTLENSHMHITVAEYGGAPIRIQLKKYKTAWQTPVTLTDSGRSVVRFLIPYGATVINTATEKFVMREYADSILRLALPLPNGAELEYIYRLPREGYEMKFEVVPHQMERLLSGNIGLIDMEWRAQILRQEWEPDQERPYTTVAYRYVDEAPNELSSRKSDEEDLVGKIDWIALKQQFFTQVLFLPDNTDKAQVAILTQTEEDDAAADSLLLKEGKAVMALSINPYSQSSFQFQWYFGPLHYGILKQIGHELTDLIPLGWAIFRWVNVWIIIPVFHFLEQFITNYGIIIFLLAVFIKLIVSPFTYKSYLSSAKMKLLAPELAELQKKYKDDPVKLQQAQLRLYQQTGVSPLGGCLPMLLQMPILIAMFRFFPASIELRQQSFLWAHDLSTYDVLLRLPFHIPFLGNHISGFALLMSLSLIIYNRFASPPSMGTPQQQQQQKLMTYFMPIFFFFIMNGYSAALSYYYLSYNILSIAQTQWFERIVNKEKLKAQIEATRQKRKNQKGGWLQRLEQMQRQQQAKRRKR